MSGIIRCASLPVHAPPGVWPTEGNRRLDLSTRAALFESAITPTFFNAGLWIPNGKTWEALCNGYSKLVRRLLVPIVGAHKAFHVPLPAAHWCTGCWRFSLVARRARLSFLVSLVQAGPSLLWAMLQAEATWFTVIREDPRWLVQGDEENWPLLIAPAWPAWHHIINSSPQAFRRRVRRRLQQTHLEQIEEDTVTVCLWHCYRTLLRRRSSDVPREAWVCYPCKRSFGTKAGLSVHFFKTHGRIAAYRHVAVGTTCSACETCFWTAGRLAAHLRASPGCVAALESQGSQTEQIAPGFGSRKKRHTDSTNFTLSLPEPLTVASHPGRRNRSGVVSNRLYIGSYAMWLCLFPVMLSQQRSQLELKGWFSVTHFTRMRSSQSSIGWFPR